jgi:RNA polymerase sigma-70 factor (ECF subfamily)
VTVQAVRAGDRSTDAAAEAAEDARLVDGAAAGDRRMFAALYRRHMVAVYQRLTRMIGPVPERDDLVQQIFLDVHRALPRFRGDARFSTFLHRIVVNVACEHLGRARRGAARARTLPREDLEAMVAPDASPEARARHRQELARVFARLDDLSPKRRVAFVLVAVEGMSLGEAGALLGATPDAVKQRVREARHELAQARGAIEQEGSS